MTIAEVRGKCKEWAEEAPHDALILGILILASIASFGLGYLAGRDAGQGSDSAIPTGSPAATGMEGEVVASKNGTKYYAPDCAGANRITEANKVWFASADEASAAGYAPAANCPGR